MEIVSAVPFPPGDALPAGVILPFAGAVNAIPAGWFACNGQNINRNANLNLYNLFLNMTGGLAVWGAGDGSTTFGIPDLRGRVPAGIDDMGTGAAGLLKTGTLGLGGFASVGLAGFGGEQTHAPVPAEQVPHYHSHAHGPSGAGQLLKNNPGGGAWVPPAAGSNIIQIATTDTDASQVNSATFSNQAANVAQPTLLVNYIIRGG